MNIRHLLLIPTLLIAASLTQGQKAKPMWYGPETKELKGKVGKHTYRVFLRVRNAKADGRKIGFSRPSDPSLAGDHFLINGAATYGFDGIPKEWAKGTSTKKALESHATEIGQFDVWIDGKRIRIPRKKYEIVFFPDIEHAEALFSKDGKTFFILVSGSDGAGSWTARWTIERGKVDVEVGNGG